MARQFRRLAGETAIYATFASPSDPNYYYDNAFKRRLEEIIEKTDPVVILDLHGSHWCPPYDVDFGKVIDEEGKSAGEAQEVP